MLEIFKAVMAEKSGERGAINIALVLLMAIGFVFIAVGFIVFQIFMDAAEDILDWTCTANTATTDATFTGFTDIVGIAPLLVLLGFISAGVFTMYLGVKIGQGAGSTKFDLGTIMLLAISIVFLALALIVFPITLEAICSTLSNNASTADTGQGINAAFTGVSDFLLMSPLLLMVSLVGGTIVAGYFGLKRLGSG